MSRSLHRGFYFENSRFSVLFLCLTFSASCSLTRLQSKLDSVNILCGAERRNPATRVLLVLQTFGHKPKYVLMLAVDEKSVDHLSQYASSSGVGRSNWSLLSVVLTTLSWLRPVFRMNFTLLTPTRLKPSLNCAQS